MLRDKFKEKNMLSDEKREIIQQFILAVKESRINYGAVNSDSKEKTLFTHQFDVCMGRSFYYPTTCCEKN